MTLTEYVIKRPSVVVVSILVIAIFGIISYTHLSYELLPKFNIPTLTVVTVYPGASPDEVESEITKKIEDNISTLENIKRIRSTSYENLSVVILEMNNGVDIDDAQGKAQRKLNAVESSLPAAAKAPTVSKVSSDDFPILKFSLSSKEKSNTAFYQFIKDRIVPQLSSIKGVASVSLIGGEERAIRVEIDQEKLKAYNMSLLMVSQSIGQNNINFPTGKLENNVSALRIKLGGKFQSLEDLENLIIARLPTGSRIKLSDIATIIDSKKDAETINRINGKSSIGLNISKQGDANAVEVAKIIKKKVAELEKQYEADAFKMQLAVDGTDYTIAAADAVKHDLLIAILLVALVMLVFLHSIRDSFIVMLAIPVSFLATLIAMYLFGYTFNLMTLLALTLVIGILVDDSIVVLENIHRHLNMGKDKVRASIDGRTEIGFTALAITFVDVVVFLPLAMTNAGIISTILGQFSWVIVISTLCSLVVSFTLTPLLSSRFATIIDLEKNHWWNKIHKAIENQIIALTNWYGGLLAWVLRNKSITIVAIFALFLSSLLLVAKGFIGSAFIEQGDRGEVVFYVETSNSNTLAYTDSVTNQIEARFMKMPEVQNVLASVGVSGSGRDAGGLKSNMSELTVQLKKDAKITDAAFAFKVKNEFNDIPGATVTDALLDINGSAGNLPVQILVSSNDRAKAIEYGKKVMDILQNTNGVSNPKLSVEDAVTEVQVTIDKEKMGDFGLNVSSVGATMATAFGGNDDYAFSQGGFEYDIVVQLKSFDRRNPEDIKSLTFINNQGQMIRLDQFATVGLGSGASQLERTDRISSVLVQSNLKGRQIGEVSPDIDATLALANFPADVAVKWIGQSADQKDGFAAIGGAFALSLVLMYLLMVLLYNNYIYPLVVLFAIPMSFIGAFLALALSQSSLTIFTIMGFVVMMGLVSKNSILIVDFANKEKADGNNTFDALLAAGKERLRPILMTTLAMVFGLLPVALATGAGASWKNGLGWALVGGLSSSMCLTVFIVPAVYMIVDVFKGTAKY